jgi:hypothetical protein
VPEQQTVLAVKPYLGQDFYVPAFSLYIKNKKFQLVQDVQSVTYSDSLTEIDSFDMTVSNWDPKSGGNKGVFKSATVRYSIPGRMSSCGWATTATARAISVGC